jgi:hypothetical protein
MARSIEKFPQRRIPVQIDKSLLQKLRPQIEAALKSVHPDLEFALGNAKFTPENAVFQLNLKIKGGLDMKDSKMVRDLVWVAKMNGLDTEKVAAIDFGGRFPGQYKLYGYNSKKPKWSYTLQEVRTGKLVLSDDRTVERHFKKAVQ